MKIKIAVKPDFPVLIGSTDYLNVSTVLDDEKSRHIFMLDLDSLFNSDDINIKKLSDIFMNYYNSKNIKESFKKLQELYSKLPSKYLIQPEIEYEELDIKKSDIKLPMGTFYSDNEKKIYKPYIPGSSLKGAVKNAVRNNFIKKHGLKLNSYNRKIEYSSNGKTSEKLDEIIFYSDFTDFNRVRHHQDILNDVFRFIEFSDFYPEDDGFSIKIHKIERLKLGVRSSPIPSYGVAIDSGTFTGTIKVSNSLNMVYNYDKAKFNEISATFHKIFDLNIEDASDTTKDIMINKMLKIVTDYYQTILNEEKSYYNSIDVNNAKPILIGFGGGIEEKTVIRSLGDPEFEKAKDIINGNNKKRKVNFQGRLPSTAWMINEKKFGVLFIEGQE